MKRILIIVGVVVLVLLGTLQISLMIAPMKTKDFFLTLNSDRFLLWTREGVFSVDIRNVEDGLDPSERIFLQRKRVAFETIVLGEDNYEKKLNEYHKALIEAGKDGLLTVEEFNYLTQLNSDIVTEEDVNNWIDLAKKYEEVIKKEKRRDKYDYLKR